MLSPGNVKYDTIKNIWKSRKLQNLKNYIKMAEETLFCHVTDVCINTLF